VFQTSDTFEIVLVVSTGFYGLVLENMVSCISSVGTLVWSDGGRACTDRFGGAHSVIRLLQRIAVFTIGIFIMAFGIAISVRANLGTSPIASFPTVLSFATPLSVGFYLTLLNLVFFLLQVLILRKNFPRIQFVQLPITLAFGVFADVGMYLTSWLDPTSYFMQWVWTLVGVVLVALGVYIETQPRLSYIPGDGLVFTLTLVLQNISFETIKMVFDWALVIIAVVVSLVLLDGLEGVREGTVFAAFGVGLVIRFISAVHKRLGGGRDEASAFEGQAAC